MLLKATKELENTSLISLDYKDILDFQSDLPRDTIKTIVDRNTIYTTPSFSPSMFKSRNDIISVGSYGMSHSATFQEKSVQRDEHHQHHQQQQHQQQQQEDDQDQDHVDLEDLEEDIPAYFIGKMYQSQLHSDWTKVIANKTVHANQQSPNTSSRIELNQSEVQRLSPNHYSEHLSPTQTQSIQDQLYLQIMKQSEKSRIIVLFLKDMTEIINTARSGKEVVVAIMSAVSKARKRGHSPIIVYNFTPSLMDSENTTKDLGIYQDMLMKEFEFGDNDGTIYRLDLWNSKQINLFASPFDAMTGSMVKINIPPVVNHIPGSNHSPNNHPF